MSYKPNGERPAEAMIPKLPCVRCHASTKTTELSMFGGMCGRCLGDYAKAPFQIPRRRESE